MNLVKRKDTGKLYAVKQIAKLNTTKSILLNSVFNERDMLAQLMPVKSVIKLHSTMQDDDFLYFLMEYAPNGHLRYMID